MTDEYQEMLDLGRWIRHGGWYPDRKLRFVRKSACRWGGTNPHDHLRVDSTVPSHIPIARLDEDDLAGDARVSAELPRDELGHVTHELHARRKDARAARLAANRAVSCKTCERTREAT